MTLRVPAMSDTAVAPDPRSPGLIARIFGVVTSPRETFAAVAATPHVLGVLVVTTLVAAGSQYWFLSSENGRKATLERIETTVRVMESITRTPVDDATYDEMIKGVDSAPAWTAGQILLLGPIITLVLAAIFLGVFNGIMGGSASYKQVCAIVAHAGVVWMLIGVFTAVMGFYTGRDTGTSSLSVFFPMLDKGFFAHLLGYLDLLYFWGFLTTSIGLAVLYRRATGPIATVMIGLYVTIGVIYAAVRAQVGA